ncbi:MAG: hypothetical protein FJY26_12375 [Betaproteobacteria bacterium]|nr:hypothetical protein [Betaproteobacteria bacterium]
MNTSAASPRAVLPNPSLMLGRYGMQRKPGVRHLRHRRTCSDQLVFSVQSPDDAVREQAALQQVHGYFGFFEAVRTRKLTFLPSFTAFTL